MSDKFEYGGVIPAEDFQLAIEACRKDPARDRYYTNAPAGARLFIGLQFYATAHAADFDDARYQQCLSEIEPELTVEDIGYLMAHEGGDAQTLAYLRELRDRVQARPVAPSLQKVKTQRILNAAVRGTVEDGASEEEQAAENARQYQEACARAVKERFTRIVILFVVLFGVGLAGFVVWRSHAGKAQEAPAERKLSPAEEAAQAEALRAERERQEKEAAEKRVKLQQERAAAAEAARLKQQKALEDMRASQAKAAEEKRAAIAEQEAAKKQYQQVRQAFRSARYAFWQDARPEDRLGAAKEETVFHCLLPAEEKNCGVYELKVAPSNETAVVQLLPDGGRAGLAFDAFAKTAAQSAHILLHGDRAYLCPAAGAAKVDLRVPASGEVFDPFQEMFGRLYTAARGFGVGNPAIAYEVVFQPKDSKVEIPVGTVFYGHSLVVGDFSDKVSLAMANRRMAAAQRARRNPRNRKRTVILTDGKEIRKRTDGVVEVPRDYVSKSSRRDGRKSPKEEQAYANWQRLYDEAVRQERLESEGSQGGEVSEYQPSDAEVEGVLREGRIVLRPKK